jgi:hypothetical protein
MCELGRVDIQAEVLMLAAFSVAPREDYLTAVLHMFAHLKTHERSNMVMDPTYIDHEAHPVHDWVDFLQVQRADSP